MESKPTISFAKIAVICFILAAIFFTPKGKEFLSDFEKVGSWEYLDGSKKYQFSGTGFFVNSNHILTSYDSVKNCKLGTIILTKSGAYSGRITSVDEQYNIAVIETSANLKVYSVLRNRVPIEGEDFKVPLFQEAPGEFELAENTSLIKDPKNMHHIIFSSNWLEDGNRGAPIYDQMGYVTGMLVQPQGKKDHPIIDNEKTSRAINLNVLVRYMNKHSIPYYKPYQPKTNLFELEAYHNIIAVGVLCAS